MISRTVRSHYWFILLILAIAVQGCGTAPSPQTPAVQTSRPVATDVPATPTPMPVATVDLKKTAVPSAEPVVPSPTLPVVMVTAVNGNLSIRSGPDESFDAIAVLKKGETVQALARSILDGWVQVPVPSMPGRTGWVSLLTNYSQVDGYVLDLPKIDIVEWPVGSYLINCTSHQLLVKPLETALPPVSQSPGNRVWFPPGFYSVYDTEVAGQPEVLQVQLGGHTEVKIRRDGNGLRSECP